MNPANWPYSLPCASGRTAFDCGGTVLAWGWNNYGQVGDCTTTDRWSPVSVSGSECVGVLNLKLSTDTTPPALTMPSLAVYYKVGSSVVLTFAATDTQTGIASVSATLNGNPVSSGSTVVLDQLGTYTFTLTATDNAGNTATQTQQFTVGKSRTKSNLLSNPFG